MQKFNPFILDFDGTICELFGENSINQLSKLLHKEMVILGIDFPVNKDCFDVFITIIKQTKQGDSKRNKAFYLADKIISNAECKAVKTAKDVSGIRNFIDFSCEHNISIGIATNNSEECVKEYLDSRGINKNIPIVGRQSLHPEYMKPNTWSATTLLNKIGTTNEKAIFVGDGVNDYMCAKLLSIDFIGMATNEKKKKQLMAIEDFFMIVDCYADIICSLQK